MARIRIQDVLLFVIALCLVLLVVHVYSGHVVSKAQAQVSGDQEVHLYGWYCSFSDCKWKQVAVDGSGRLLTATK